VDAEEVDDGAAEKAAVERPDEQHGDDQAARDLRPSRPAGQQEVQHCRKEKMGILSYCTLAWLFLARERCCERISTFSILLKELVFLRKDSNGLKKFFSPFIIVFSVTEKSRPLESLCSNQGFKSTFSIYTKLLKDQTFEKSLGWIQF
jgi:hypothetical protein